MSKVIYGAVRLEGNLGSGTGDPLLTRDATTNEVGTVVSSIGTLTNGHILVGNASNVATDVAVTGDVTISNTGVTAITSGVIVNADINASAAIAYSKLDTLTASRALVSNGSGVISASSVTGTELGYVSGVTSAIQTQLNAKQATITGAATTVVSSNLTPNRVATSNGIGKLDISTVTTTELGYLSGASSNLQTQLGTKLTTSLGVTAQGDIIYHNGSAWTNLPRGTSGQALYSTGTSIQWDTPTINGIPLGGTAGQALIKISGTDFDADWSTLVTASITDISASAAELNILDGATLTTSELNYVDGVTSAIQPQLDGKLSQSLSQNSIFVGNASNIATAYAAGSNGQVLTISGGVPTWQTIVGTGSVTSVNVSGGTTGLSFTGGPVTTSGTITASGTLAIANGGTGLTSLGSALQLLRVNSGGTALEYGAADYWNVTGTTSLTGDVDIDGPYYVHIGDNDSIQDFEVWTVNAASGGYVRFATGTFNVFLSGGTNSLTMNTTDGLNFNIQGDSGVAGQSIRKKADNTGFEYYTPPSGISGLTTNRIPYATSATTLGDDNGLTWDSSNNALTVNTTVRFHATTSSLSTGISNLFIGENSGNFTNSGAFLNIGLGYSTLTSLTSGDRNIAIGDFAGSGITTGLQNIAIGRTALAGVTTNGNNIAIGNESASLLTGGANIILGSFSGSNLTTGSNNIIIGSQAEVPSATANGQLSIQNAIFGADNTAIGATVSTGTLGAFVASPTASFDIAASTTAKASLRIRSGTAPTTPNDGDMWHDNTNIYIRIGGVTRTFTLV